MKPPGGIFFLLTALALTSCAETTVGDVRVHGPVDSLPSNEIRAIIAANPAHKKIFGDDVTAGSRTVQFRHPVIHQHKIYEIQIISDSEMHVYYEPINQSAGYAIVRRVNGKWRYLGEVFFTP